VLQGKHPVTRCKATISGPHFPTGAQLAFAQKQGGRSAGAVPAAAALPDPGPAVPVASHPPAPGRILQCFGIRLSEIDEFVEWARLARAKRQPSNDDPEASSDDD
jgi:hypothetical protein